MLVWSNSHSAPGAIIIEKGQTFNPFFTMWTWGDIVQVRMSSYLIQALCCWCLHPTQKMVQKKTVRSCHTFYVCTNDIPSGWNMVSSTHTWHCSRFIPGSELKESLLEKVGVHTWSWGMEYKLILSFEPQEFISYAHKIFSYPNNSPRDLGTFYLVNPSSHHGEE